MWVNTNLPEFQNESVREIKSIWANQQTIWKEITKLDQWKFLIYLYDNHFQSFLTVLWDLIAISISSLMNYKRAFFNFKIKLPRVHAMNISSNVPFVLTDKLLKFAKHFHCGTEIWDKIINSKSVFKISVLCLLWRPNFIKITSYLKHRCISTQI